MRDFPVLAFVLLAVATFAACSEEREHLAPAVNPKDSVATMVTYGVNTMISDSGVIKYRIVSEKWEINQNRNPSRWIFHKGLFLEQFDLAKHVQAYIQCDTAYYYDMRRLWELHGRVRILTKKGLKFSSEELFWDERQHEFYSNKFSHLITEDKELQGNRFRSDEYMTKYSVKMTKGYFDKKDIGQSDNNQTQNNDSTNHWGRQPKHPRRIHNN